MMMFPKLRISNCMADALNAYIIDCDGLLYKCWNDVGIKNECVGFIDDSGRMQLNNKLAVWLGWDPFVLDGCKDCKFLPLCLGGCPYKQIKGLSKSCVGWKYNIQEILNLIYLSKLKNINKSKEEKINNKRR